MPRIVKIRERIKSEFDNSCMVSSFMSYKILVRKRLNYIISAPIIIEGAKIGNCLVRFGRGCGRQFHIILQYAAVFQPRVLFLFQGNAQYITNRPFFVHRKITLGASVLKTKNCQNLLIRLAVTFRTCV